MEKLIEIKRGEITEREHWGYCLLTDAHSVLYKNFEDDDRHFYLRSCAKPMQASVFKDLGVFKKFGFSSAEIAIVSSSHSGTRAHTDLVVGILQKIGLDESYLHCGVHPPLDKGARHDLIRKSQEPSAVHNNCSGKHAGFLASCILQDWPLEDYLAAEHPLQVFINQKISKYCDYNSLFISQDGCFAPIMAVPLPNMCLGFSRCFSDNSDIAEAFAKNPEIIGGAGRIDTEVIRASSGKLIAKVGAEGLCMVYNTQNAKVLAVKILDSNMQARSIALIGSLLDLGWLSPEELEGAPLNELYERMVKSGNIVVGDIIRSFKIPPQA